MQNDKLSGAILKIFSRTGEWFPLHLVPLQQKLNFRGVIKIRSFFQHPHENLIFDAIALFYRIHFQTILFMLYFN